MNGTAPHIKLAIDWERFLDRQDMVWETLKADFYDGPFIGNGLLGAVIHRQDPNRGDGNTNTLLWEVNRGDCIDEGYPQNEGYTWSRMNVGKFGFTPRGKIAAIRMRICLWNAEITGTIETDRGTIELRSFVHATEPVIVTELKAAGGESVDDWKFLPDPSGCMKQFGGIDFQERAVYDPPNPPAEAAHDESTFRYKQTLHSSRFFEVGDLSMKSDCGVVHFTTIAYSDPVDAEPFEVQDVFGLCRKTNLEDLVQSHRKWWHEFYPGSFISIPDSRLENFYWIQQYKLASATRPQLQMLDIVGLWYVHTCWRAIWWNWNTQGAYSSLFTCNRVEFGEPLYRTLDRCTEALAENVPPEYEHDSAAIGRASSFDCRSFVSLQRDASCLDRTCLGADRELSCVLNPKHPRNSPQACIGSGLEIGNLTWVLQVYYQHCRYTMDHARLRERVFPLLKRCVNLYLHLAAKDAEGVCHLPMTCSPEYGCAHDCNYDLMLFRWGCATLISICEQFDIADPLLPRWRDVVANLAPYPANETGWLIGRDTPLARGHRHFSHLLAFYPLHTVNPEIEQEREVIERALDHWLTVGNERLAAWSYAAAAGMYATLRNGEKAAEQLHQSIAMFPAWPTFSANTMYREVGPCFETPLFVMNSLTEMLLQSWGDTVRVFPAVPQQWRNVSFHRLRAEGAFLISAVRKDGLTQCIEVESLAGGVCRLETDLPLEKVQVSGRNPIRFSVTRDRRLELTLRKGDRALIYSDPGASFHCAPIEMPGQVHNCFGSKHASEVQ